MYYMYCKYSLYYIYSVYLENGSLYKQRESSPSSLSVNWNLGLSQSSISYLDHRSGFKTTFVDLYVLLEGIASHNKILGLRKIYKFNLKWPPPPAPAVLQNLHSFTTVPLKLSTEQHSERCRQLLSLDKWAILFLKDETSDHT